MVCILYSTQCNLYSKPFKPKLEEHKIQKQLLAPILFEWINYNLIIMFINKVIWVWFWRVISTQWIKDIGDLNWVETNSTSCGKHLRFTITYIVWLVHIWSQHLPLMDVDILTLWALIEEGKAHCKGIYCWFLKNVNNVTCSQLMQQLDALKVLINMQWGIYHCMTMVSETERSHGGQMMWVAQLK